MSALANYLGDHVFWRDAEKVQKNESPNTNGPKLMHFFPKKFYPHFSGNPANVLGNDIFPVQKTLQKMMKITRFELLRAPFVDRDQVCIREAKIMQNDSKMQLKSSQNDHEKTWIPILQWSETHAIDRPMKMHKNVVFLSFPLLLCSRHGCKTHFKSLKIHQKIITKNTKPGLAMVNSTRRRPTCENA